MLLEFAIILSAFEIISKTEDNTFSSSIDAFFANKQAMLEATATISSPQHALSMQFSIWRFIYSILIADRYNAPFIII